MEFFLGVTLQAGEISTSDDDYVAELLSSLIQICVQDKDTSSSKELK